MRTSASADSWNYIKSTASESSDCKRRTNIMLMCREYMFRFLRVYCCLCTRVLGRGVHELAEAPRPTDVLPQRIPSTDKSRYTKRPASGVCAQDIFLCGRDETCFATHKAQQSAQASQCTRYCSLPFTTTIP